MFYLFGQDYELLCMDGRRAAVSQAATCNWGTVAAHVVSTAAIHDLEVRENYKLLIRLINYDFGVNGQFKNLFNLYDSSQWNTHDLLFTDETVDLVDVSEVDSPEGGARDTYYTWVGMYRFILSVAMGHNLAEGKSPCLFACFSFHLCSAKFT